MVDELVQPESPFVVKVTPDDRRATVRKPNAPRTRQEIRHLLDKEDSPTAKKHDVPEKGTIGPFDETEAKLALLSAGYLELFGTSMKQIKARFVHGLEKQKFKSHLQAFLALKTIKPTTEFMIRFIGKAEVHSPFIHLFTATLIEDTATVKVSPTEPSDAGNTLWTFLESEQNKMHWSCKKSGFWPVKVVFEGPPSSSVDAGDGLVGNSRKPSPRSRGRSRERSREQNEDDAPESPEIELKRNTRQNSKHINHPKRKVIDFNELDSEKPEKEPVTRSANELSEAAQAQKSPPTIGSAMRQLGIAVANAIPPQVTSTVQQKLEAFRGWTRRGQLQDVGDEERDVLEREAAERRERRRLRRLATVHDDDAEEPELEVRRSSSSRRHGHSSRSRR
ncbi:hypothetical protein OIV83_001822 [Microbotryomycetes sp. JL201]|nr:hypothetical protein OIV83_001822 [Microbotryomycetes sp. JL201]